MMPVITGLVNMNSNTETDTAYAMDWLENESHRIRMRR